MNYNLIQNSKFKIQNSRKAFTLIELLVAIAIIGILAAVVIISMSSYAKRARSAKALAEVSSAIPSAMSCLGNGGTVKTPRPSGGVDICEIGPSYGLWPVLGALGTDLANYSYIANWWPSSAKWYLRVYSAKDDVAICCSSAMNGCGIIGVASTYSTCNDSKTW